MKMVSAAKLRRAQERAMQARPYAQMLVNVLESLVRRTDLYNEQTGEILHPLLVEREEKIRRSSSSSPATRASPAASTRTSARQRRSSSTYPHREGSEHRSRAHRQEGHRASTRREVPAANYEKTEEKLR